MNSLQDSWKGKAVPPREDRRFITGQGTYIADLQPDRMLHAGILRSVHPHARILSIDIREALRVPGVVRVLTGEEVAKLTRPLRSLVPLRTEIPNYCLAYQKVRYVGEPVVAVVALNR